MKTHLLLAVAGLLALAPIAAQAKIERVVEKTFTVRPGGTLTLETQGGDVRILTSNEATVKVTAKEKIKASSQTEADELLKKLTLAIEQVPEGVSALAKYEKPMGGWHFGSWPPVQVDFTVTVPANYNVSLKTTGGDIKVPELGGKVYARTSGGDVTLGRIAGEIDAGTSGGDIRLTEGGATVRLTTSGGDIHVDRAVGATDLDTSGGDIVIKSVENTLHASTSGGNVTAGITGALKGECRLGTSGGRVRVTVDKGTAFDLNASTSGGEVDATGLTITIEKGRVSRSKLEGKVNGGGPLLKLRSSGGDISVQTR